MCCQLNWHPMVKLWMFCIHFQRFLGFYSFLFFSFDFKQMFFYCDLKLVLVFCFIRSQIYTRFQLILTFLVKFRCFYLRAIDLDLVMVSRYPTGWSSFRYFLFILINSLIYWQNSNNLNSYYLLNMYPFL